MKKSFQILVLISNISASAFASTLSLHEEVIYCLPVYQGFKFAATYYATPFWQEQLPPMVSCDYGLKPDGSYHAYYSNPFYMAAQENGSSWQPDPQYTGWQKCVTSDPVLCPYTLYTANTKNPV